MSKDGVGLSLSDFCALIDSSQSLNTANIVSVECWRTQTTVLRIPHRFLIFRLRRRNRSDVWLRVDRRPASRTKLFPRGRAETKDTASIQAVCMTVVGPLMNWDPRQVRLLAERSGLTPQATQENLMTFSTTPTLGNVRFFLQIITEELREYQIWPVSKDDLHLSYEERNSSNPSIAKLLFSYLPTPRTPGDGVWWALQFWKDSPHQSCRQSSINHSRSSISYTTAST